MLEELKNRLRIVLVETSHAGNIGAAARAMKNMGLRKLVLVAPQKFPHADATARASGADDVLAAADVCSTLDEAIAECGLVVGASARLRSLNVPLLDPRQCAQQVCKEIPNTQVAIVFGREDSGLTNDELSRCHYLVHIPSDPEYSSLNLAAAVQVVSYECRMASGIKPVAEIECERGEEPVGAEDMSRFYQHLQQTLVDIEFLDAENPRIMMRRLRRLYNRARPNKVEMNILRGILTATQKCVKNLKPSNNE